MNVCVNRSDGFLGKFSDLENKNIHIHQNRCTLVRNRNTKCLKCVEACISGCISIINSELVINTELCTGCGTCATACPTSALEARNPCDSELINLSIQATKTISENEHSLTYVCQRFYEKNNCNINFMDIVVVTCLGRIEESLLLNLFEKKDVKYFYLVHGECSECRYGKGIKTAEIVSETVQKISKAWDLNIELNLLSTLPSYIKVTKENSCAVNANHKICEPLETKNCGQSFSYMKVMDDGTLPHFIPEKRERLLDTLTILGKPKDKTLQTHLFGEVSINQEICMSCQMCTTFCPTGAITKLKNDSGDFGIIHYPSDCVNCKSCEDICPTKALTIKEKVHLENVVNGVGDYHSMQPMKNAPNSPHQILNAMRDLIKAENIFER